MKKMVALMVGVLVLGLAFAAAQDQTETKSQEKAQIKTGLKAAGETQQNKVQAKSEFRHRNRIAFVD
jgi:Tfp pilus assembly protein PilO